MFAIVAVGMLEIRRGVVTTAEVNFDARPVDSHRDAPETAVLRRIRAVIAEQIVDRSVLLHAGEHAAEIVRIKKRAPARVPGQSDQRFLSSGVGVERTRYCLA